MNWEIYVKMIIENVGFVNFSLKLKGSLVTQQTLKELINKIVIYIYKLF